jgi:hypothetical protein
VQSSTEDFELFNYLIHARFLPETIVYWAIVRPTEHRGGGSAVVVTKERNVHILWCVDYPPGQRTDALIRSHFIHASRMCVLERAVQLRILALGTDRMFEIFNALSADNLPPEAELFEFTSRVLREALEE